MGNLAGSSIERKICKESSMTGHSDVTKSIGSGGGNFDRARFHRSFRLRRDFG